jgi:hypothetical protein
MSHPGHRLSAAFGLALVVIALRPGFAQQVAPSAPPLNAQPPATKAATESPHRNLAPGVMRSVDPARQIAESYSRHDIVELLAVDPKLDFAKDISFRHDVWTLEFQFKPLRTIWVDIPQVSGKMRRELIWYLVYSVTNSGKIMHPVAEAPLPYKTNAGKPVFQLEYLDRPVRFIPEFLLEGRQSLKEGVGFTKVYADRVIPAAIGPIRTREDRSRPLLNTAEICMDIAVGQTVWGVATWEHLDPQIKQVSIYIQGLSNVYRWKDQPGEYKAGDPPGTGRRPQRKTLKLNFWRPGEDYLEHEEQIRYGIPGGLDYEWVYR